MYIIDPLFVDFNESATFSSDDSIYGNWRIIEGKDTRLYLNDLLPILNKKGFQLVRFDHIAWKGFNLSMDKRGMNCVCCGGERYIHCNTRVPGILLEGVKTPRGKRYMCIDGKHRIEALLSYDMEYGNFCVLNFDDIKDHLRFKK
tara:strand:- start:781 stop:1215 length:435 start_codon:yes stop_codon:yes gene_type:complete